MAARAVARVVGWHGAGVSGVRQSVSLDDGSLLVAADMAAPLIEEYAARGRLTVTEAQCLVERWGLESRSRR